MNNSETAMIQLQFDAKEVNGVITDAMVVMTNLSEVVEEIGASIGKVLPQMLTILEKSQGCLRDIADSTTEIFEKLSELTSFLKEALSETNWLDSISTVSGTVADFLDIGEKISLMPKGELKEGAGILGSLMMGRGVASGLANPEAGTISKAFLGVGKKILAAIGTVSAEVAMVAAIIIATIILVATTIYVYWDEISGFLSKIPQWFQENISQPIGDCIGGIREWFGGLFGGMLKMAWDWLYNCGVVVGAVLGLIFNALVACWEWISENIVEPAKEWLIAFWGDAILNTDENIQKLQETIAPFVAYFDEHFIQPLVESFSDWCESLPGDLGETIETMISDLGDFAAFWSQVCGDAWTELVELFSTEGLNFEEMQSGVSQIFKGMLNEIISAINALIAVPFISLNAEIDKLRNTTILDYQPFSKLRSISVPQIPLLAQGAVLPANKPFLAMVGDQKHGTNVEAPMATIQEALANVLAQQGMGGDIHITFTGDLAQLGRGDLSVLGSIGWRKPGFPKADS